MRGSFGFRSEFARLDSVLLHRPGPEIEKVRDPERVLHLRPISRAGIDREYEGILRMFEGLGVETRLIEPTLAAAEDHACLLNMMYVRDLFFMAPGGAVLARMAYPVRRGEPPHAAGALEAMGVPVAAAVEEPGTFEGADALWVDRSLVAVGVGNRTNREGFEQLRKLLRADGVECVPLPPPGRTQHLLGAVQLVGEGRALVRTDLAGGAVTEFLRERGIEIIEVPESDEVRERQAMNVVVAEPGRVIMPSGCPRTRELYERAGLAVAAEVELGQLVNGGGGLACATGIIARAT